MADFPIIGGKIEFDATDASKTIRVLSKEISNIRSETKLALASVEGGERSIEGLRVKIASLSEVIKKQSVIVAKYQEEYQKLVDTKGASDYETLQKKSALLERQASLINSINEKEAYTVELSKALNKEKFGVKGLEELSTEVSSFSPRLGALISKFSDIRAVVGGVAVAIGTTLVKAISNGVKAFVEYESAFTNVRKTVDGSEADFERLNAQITEMSKTLPKSASDIAKITALGGQLGISVNNLADFTETMVKLGDATNITSEEASELVAQVQNLTGFDSTEYENFGSALTALGNNFATTEDKILDSTQRIAQFSKSVGLSTQEVLGIATALSALGLESDASGTAIQKIFTQLQLAVETGNEDLEKFARVANMTTENFTELFKKSSIEGFTSLLEGIGNLANKGQSAVVTINELGIKETRLSSVLQALVGSTKTLNNALEISNKAWEENIALTNEASRKYETLEAQTTLTSNAWSALFRNVGGTFAGVWKGFLNFSGGVAEGLNNLLYPAQKFEVTFLEVSNALEDYTNKATEAKKNNTELASSFKEATITTLASNLETINDKFEDTNKETKKATKTLKDLKESYNEVINSDIAQNFLNVANSIDSNITTIDEAFALLNSLPAVSVNIDETKRDALINYGTLLEELVANNKDLITQQETNLDALEQTKKSLVDTYAIAVEKGLISIDYIKSYGDEFADAINKRNNAIKDADNYALKHIATIQKQLYAYEELSEGANFLAKEIEKQKDVLASYEVDTTEYEKQAKYLDLLTKLQEKYNNAIEKQTSVQIDVSQLLDETSLPYKSIEEFVGALGTETEKKASELATWKEYSNSLSKVLEQATEAGINNADLESVKSLKNLYDKQIAQLGKELQELEAPQVVAPFSADSYITQYGTEAEKTALKLADLKTLLNSLNAEMSNKNVKEGSKEWQEYKKAIELVTRYQNELKTSLTETTVELFNADSYITQYGTEAEKTALKIKNLDEEINKLKERLATSTDTSEQAELQKAISLLTSQKKTLLESGKESGKMWLDSFVEAIQPTDEFTKFIEKIENSFGVIGNYLSQYFTQALNIVTSSMSQEVSVIESQINKLDENLEDKKEAIETTQNNRLAQLETLYESGEITELAYYSKTAKANEEAERAKRQAEQTTAQEREALAKKQEELKKKQFNADKTNSIATATINGAQAILKGYASLSPALATVNAGIVGALTTAQIAVIASQQYIPALAKGGIATAPTLAMVGDNPSRNEAIIPLESRTLSMLADKIVGSMQKEHNTVVYNTQNDDNKSYVINQQINQQHAQTRREIYLQTRKALRENATR